MKITGKISSLFVLICFLMIPQIQAERGIKVGEKKTALVIGNADYKVGRLANPLNDARDMASLLKQTGFSVNLLTNSDQRGMERAIRQFGKQLRDGGVGLFYYAGHGMQVKGGQLPDSHQLQYRNGSGNQV